MKIRIAILENDVLYAERLTAHFTKYYADKLEVYAYSSWEMLQAEMQSIRFGCLLAAEQFASQIKQLPEHTGLLYLVEQNDIEKMEEVPVVGKYQRPESIYRQILAIYSAKIDKKFSKKNRNDADCKVYMVTSPSGGAGTSTIAVSLSKYLAKQGKKVLYISLESNGAQDIFFDGQESRTFSDIIYLLKSKKANLALRAESIVQRDSSGVYYFKQCSNILDIEELDKEDIKTLVREICMLSDYEYVVIDTQMHFTEGHLYIAECADAILTVCDGSEISLRKMQQFIKALEITDSQKGKNLIARLSILYNKFSSKTSRMYENEHIQVLGGIQKFEGVSEKEIVHQILLKQIFNKLL